MSRLAVVLTVAVAATAGGCGDRVSLDADGAVGPVTVTVTSPNGGEQLVAAEPVVVAWTGRDPGGGALSFEVTLVDGDGVATPIASVVEVAGELAGSVTWTPVGVPAPTPYRIRVTATSDRGQSGTDESDAVFTVSPPTTEVSLAADLQPLFTARCTTMFCHGTSSQVALLHLAPGFAYGALVEVQLGRGGVHVLQARTRRRSGSELPAVQAAGRRSVPGRGADAQGGRGAVGRRARRDPRVDRGGREEQLRAAARG